MPILLREYLNCTPVNSADSSHCCNGIHCKENLQNNYNPISDDSIFQEIEGLHAGLTRNFTWYRTEALKSSIPSWTQPYQKPLTMNHDEKNAEKIIGRVHAVNYIETGTRSGTPALRFICNVASEEGIKGIKDGRLKTVSVGAIATKATCSICGQPIESLDANGLPECKHVRGAYYDDKLCYWNIWEMEAKEISYVTVPSDIYTHNLGTYKASEAKSLLGLKESLNYKKGENVIMENQNVKSTEPKANSNVDVKENSTLDEHVKEDDPNAASAGQVTEENQKGIIEQKDQEIKLLKEQLAEEKKKTGKIQESLTKVTNDLNTALASIKDLNAKLEQEIALKEAAENLNISSKAQLREMMEESIVSYRSALNKPELKESLKERSYDSLKDSLADLKEEFSQHKAEKGIQQINDPTLKESNEKQNKIAQVSVKESTTSSNNNIDAVKQSIALKEKLFN